MRLVEKGLGSHSLKQYTFRCNENEVESLLTVIELAKAYVPKHPRSKHIIELRKQINNASRELSKALKEQTND